MSNATFKTPPALAREWGVEPAKILSWLRSGELRGVNLAASLGGRARWKIPPDAIEDFLRRRSSSPEPRPTRRRKVSFQRKYYA